MNCCGIDGKLLARAAATAAADAWMVSEQTQAIYWLFTPINKARLNEENGKRPQVIREASSIRAFDAAECRTDLASSSADGGGGDE